jgi:hypothetical protein
VSKRTKFLLGIGVIAALVVGWQVAAFAVHDTGAFELEGNAVNDAAPGDDWANVFAGTTTGSTATSFVSEQDNLQKSIFTGGGSKDPQDVSNWAWKDDAGGLPDKDNLLHSFAARYNTSDGDVLFFGSDRYDNSGDAQQGFWFFQNKISQVGTGSGKFSGVHKNGDLLVVSDFSVGGTTSTINVYKWDSTCNKGVNAPGAGDCADANLRLLAASNSAKCGTSADDEFCGIVNPGPGLTTSPWPFLDKSANTNFANGEFYEGGVNLSKLGLNNECFSSVASETRSSTSTTAVLKDFVLGQLQNCSASMTTQASNTGTVTPGTSVTDSATISVAGATNAPDPTGNVTFFLCAGACTSSTSGGTQVGQPVALVGGTNTTDGTATATSAAVNTATAKLNPGNYCFRAVWPGDTNYPGTQSHTNTTTECFTVQDTSAISTTQSWVPNDSAHVTTGSGGAPAGTVTFQAFESDNCQGTEIAGLTGLTDRPVNASGDAVTANTTAVTATKTISWKATFTPTGTGTTGSTATCETSTVTITN